MEVGESEHHHGGTEAVDRRSGRDGEGCRVWFGDCRANICGRVVSNQIPVEALQGVWIDTLNLSIFFWGRHERRHIQHDSYMSHYIIRYKCFFWYVLFCYEFLLECVASSELS